MCVFWVVVWVCLCRDANNLRVAVIACGVLCCLRGACVFVLLAWLWLVWRAPLRGSCGLSFASLLVMQEFSFWFLIRDQCNNVCACVVVLFVVVCLASTLFLVLLLKHFNSLCGWLVDRIKKKSVGDVHVCL